jgi:hypothetical protein
MRKEAGFRVADRIATYYAGDSALGEAIQDYADYLRAETLSQEVVAGEPPADAYRWQGQIDGRRLVLGVRRLSDQVAS